MKVRYGRVLPERIREWLTEESLLQYQEASGATGQGQALSLRFDLVARTGVSPVLTIRLGWEAEDK